MKKKSLTAMSACGETLAWRIWVPENMPIRGIVQLVHGMAEHIDRYDETARALTDAGYLVTGHTHAGHGANAKIPGFFGMKNGWQHLLDDIHTIRQMTEKKYPAYPYFILGHSMGSFLTRCYLADHGEGLTGAVLSGTGHYPYAIAGAGLAVANIVCLLGGAKKPSKLIDKLAFSANNKPFQPAKTPVDWLSRDDAKVNSYIADPYCGFIFTGAGYRDLFRGLIRMNSTKNMRWIPDDLPILFISGDRDPVGSMGKGVTLVAQRMRAAGVRRVDVKLYEGGRHEMLNETNRGAVCADLLTWLKLWS